MPDLAEADAPAGLVSRGRAARFAWLCAGLVLMGIGFVGLFVPLLPTTDFLLLALPCFARSSPRLESWLLNHPRFGAALRAWKTHRAVPTHAKIAACLGMSFGYGLFCTLAGPGLSVRHPRSDKRWAGCSYGVGGWCNLV